MKQLTLPHPGACCAPRAARFAAGLPESDGTTATVDPCAPCGRVWWATRDGRHGCAATSVEAWAGLDAAKNKRPRI